MRYKPLFRLFHVNTPCVHSIPNDRSDCIENRLYSDTTPSIGTYRPLKSAMWRSHLPSAIARGDLTDCIEQLENWGMDLGTAIMLLPLIQAEMGGEG